MEKEHMLALTKLLVDVATSDVALLATPELISELLVPLKVMRVR